MAEMPPRHSPSNKRRVPALNQAWNHLQVPNYYIRKPPSYQNTMWHSPPTGGSAGVNNLKTHPPSTNVAHHNTSPDDGGGVDLTLTRNNGTSSPLSLSVRDPVSTTPPLPPPTNKSKSIRSPPVPTTPQKRASVKVDSILQRIHPTTAVQTVAPSNCIDLSLDDCDIDDSYGSKSRRKSKLPCKRPPMVMHDNDNDSSRQRFDNDGDIENRLEQMFAGIEDDSNRPEEVIRVLTVNNNNNNNNKANDIDTSTTVIEIKDDSSDDDDVLEEVIVNENRVVVAQQENVTSTTEKTPTTTVTTPVTSRKRAQSTTTPTNASKKRRKTSKTNVLKCKQQQQQKCVVAKVVRRARGPFVRVAGSRDCPKSVTVVNSVTTSGDVDGPDDVTSVKWKCRTADDCYDTLFKQRSKQLHTSTLSQQYDTKTRDPHWICVFCKRGPHATDFHGPTVNLGHLPAAGDLFGPYFITSHCDEYERRLTDPFDKQFKSRKMAQAITEASKTVSMQPKRQRQRKHSESSGATTTPVTAANPTTNDYLDMNNVMCGVLEAAPSSASKDMYEVWVHEGCAVWTAGTYLVGAKLYGLQEAVWTTCNVMCAKCMVRGANISCVHRGCVQVMHYCCAHMSNWQFDVDTFRTYCAQHRVT